MAGSWIFIEEGPVPLRCWWSGSKKDNPNIKGYLDSDFTTKMGLESFNGKITTGNIAEFIIYINMLTWPIASIGWITSLIQRAEASMKRLFLFCRKMLSDSVSPKEFFRKVWKRSDCLRM